MTSSRRCRAFVLAACLLTSACEVGPDYAPPAPDLPDAWIEGYAAANPAAEKQPWWQDFNDPSLTALIEKALANNQNIAIAAERINEARGLRESSFGKLLPQIGGDLGASRGNPGAPTTSSILSTYQGAFDATWEIDLFGGQRRRVEAEEAQQGMAEAAYRHASITLAGEVARDYILLRQFQGQMDTTRKTAELQKHLYDIAQDRQKGGLVSDLDVAQARTLYEVTEARIPAFESQIAAASYRLSVLLGEKPGSVSALTDTPAPIPEAERLPVLNAPSDIIRRRPDVAEAERQLAAATALQGVAVSALYPTVSLAALFGTQYGTLPVFEYAATHQIWNLGANVTMPILNFGAIDGQIDAADAKQAQALHHYKQTVLQALADIETDLSNLSKEKKRDGMLRQAAKSADHAVDIAHDRYRSGLTDFTSVLQAEQQRFSVQIDQIASQSETAQDIVALHKALGDDPSPLPADE